MVSKTLREKAEEWLTELNKIYNGMFRLVKELKFVVKKLREEYV